MKSKDLFLWAGAGFLVWYLAKQSQRIDIGSASISFLKLEGNGIRLKVKVPVLNRSDITATVQGFLGQLLFKNSSLGTIQLDHQVVIPARGTAEPEFVTVLPFASLAVEIWTFLRATVLNETLPPTSEVINWGDFRVAGTLYVSGLAVDLNQKIFE